MMKRLILVFFNRTSTDLLLEHILHACVVRVNIKRRCLLIDSMPSPDLLLHLTILRNHPALID
jgi:hypothetical protein